MKYSVLLLLLALLAGGCSEDPEIRELKNIGAQQRDQMDQMLRAQQVALDQLGVQLGRDAQAESESKVTSTFNSLGIGTLIVLGCGLAVSLAVHMRKGRTHAQREG